MLLYPENCDRAAVAAQTLNLLGPLSVCLLERSCWDTNDDATSRPLQLNLHPISGRLCELRLRQQNATFFLGRTPNATASKHRAISAFIWKLHTKRVSRIKEGPAGACSNLIHVDAVSCLCPLRRNKGLPSHVYEKVTINRILFRNTCRDTSMYIPNLLWLVCTCSEADSQCGRIQEFLYKAHVINPIFLCGCSGARC